jgi:hypothetical protein
VSTKGTGMLCDWPTLLIRIATCLSVRSLVRELYSGSEALAKSMESVSTEIEGEAVLIWDARLSSLDWVRETSTRLKPLRAICSANSLPMPSDAPVMTAQLPFLPKLESWMS